MPVPICRWKPYGVIGLMLVQSVDSSTSKSRERILWFEQAMRGLLSVHN